jgi:hypothetical protein
LRWRVGLNTGTGTVQSVVSTLANATLFQAQRDLTGQRRLRKPGVGIFLKSQEVLFPWHHVSIRVTPDDSSWITSTSYPGFGTDQFSNKFITLGAGPDATGCFGEKLRAEFNRDRDVTATASSPLKRLPLDGAEEISIQNSLIAKHSTFITQSNDQLSYNCWPGTYGGFNSNSYAHGLLHAASAAHDEAPFTVNTSGWEIQVPAVHFTSGP